MNMNKPNGDCAIQAVYFNSIGIVIVFISLSDIEENCLAQMKFLHKCDNGKLYIKLSIREITKTFLIFFSASMRVFDIKKTIPKVIVSNNSSAVLHIRYSVTKNLFQETIIFDKLGILNIYDCLNIPNDSQHLSLVSLQCKNCSNILYKALTTNKIVRNFNYDYVDNLEILSCHETLIDHIIPNLDQKLKLIINLDEFNIQINQYLAGFTSFNPNESVYCTQCSLEIGFFSQLQKNKLDCINYNLAKTVINISPDEENLSSACYLDLEKYLQLLVNFCLKENKKSLVLRSSILIITMIVKLNFFFCVEDNSAHSHPVLDNPKSYIAVQYDIAQYSQDYQSNIEEEITCSFLEEDLERIFSILDSNEKFYLTIRQLFYSLDCNEKKKYYIIQIC